MSICDILFKDYKINGGEMSQEDFERIKSVKYTNNYFLKSFEEVMKLRANGPYPHEFIDTYARVSKVKPEKDLQWRLNQTYILFGLNGGNGKFKPA